MFEVNAVFSHKEVNFEPKNCVVEKVIHLSGKEYDDFAASMLMDRDFIKDNVDFMYHDSTGKLHALLVVGEGRPDGILVDSSGNSYARYSAFVPGIGDALPIMKYPALADLNQKLEQLADYIVEQVSERIIFDEAARIDIEDLEAQFNVTLDENMLHTVFDMLAAVPEIDDIEIDKNELLVYSTANMDVTAIEEPISDPSVSQTDMYAYGYSYEGMIPVSKEKAIELSVQGFQVYKLYGDDSEGAVDDHGEMNDFDGMLGVEDPAWDKSPYTESLEVFILDREQHELGIASGEWLTLPASANDLQGLLERIGVERPSENAFSVTAVRAPHEFMLDYVSKYDSLDELNMLASYMNDMEDYEHSIFQAIATSGVIYIGNGIEALINVLDADNFNAFNMTAVNNTKELGEYWQGDKPDGISIEDYGKQLAADEQGKFTEWGYINFRYKELSLEYTGAVPDEYKIVEGAIQGLRQKAPHSVAKALSVSERIKEARQTPSVPKKQLDTQKKPKANGGPDL